MFSGLMERQLDWLSSSDRWLKQLGLAEEIGLHSVRQWQG